MQEHGTINFKFEESILTVEGSGPWNKETLVASSEDAFLVQKKITEDKWGVIVIINGEPIHTPEAAELLIEYVKGDIQKGRIATAIILIDCPFPDIGIRHLSDIYNRSGEKFQFFNNVSNAKAWMISLLEK